MVNLEFIRAKRVLAAAGTKLISRLRKVAENIAAVDQQIDRKAKQHFVYMLPVD